MGAICYSEKKSKPRVITATNLQELSRKPSNITQKNVFIERRESYREIYTINDIINSTPYIRVYKVMHKETNETRALKIIKKKYFQTTIEEEKNILSELQTLVTMEHPNILKYFEFFNDNEYYYIVSELCKGENMYKTITSLNNFSEFDARNIMEQLFSALFYIHSKGIIHRELRPENVILEKDENDYLNIKLIRFGLTGFCETKSKIFRCREIDYFIAPEVLENNFNYKFDLWSCGVILHSLLAGTPPFDGKNIAEIKENIKTGKVNFDSKEWNDISKEAKILLTSLLRIDAGKRVSAEEAWNGTWIKKFTKNKKNQILTKTKINTERFLNFSLKQTFLQDLYTFILYQYSSKDLIKELKEILISLDKNKNGKLSFLEIKEGFKKYYGEEIAERELGEYIKDNSFDNDKYIIYEEFLVNINSTNQVLINNNLKLSFDCLDNRRKGKIPKDELSNLIKLELKEVITESSILQGVVKEIENHSDHSISFEELKELIKLVIK